jgi:hypothetical protein
MVNITQQLAKSNNIAKFSSRFKVLNCYNLYLIFRKELSLLISIRSNLTE